ncbi:type IV secretory system conjugative DNA transfer family protein [Agrobacterium salinitolerans]|uniref:type IV secretory system conjugative DNA transfer family protein n=4 Tax=Pseudomonadota TaxID=1224 RepID=UPI0022B849DF|nr:type IV secretory system conjugative DNA transfer family protein [Agrobacterium salinitolerans]MCZ7889461.1 type IV secretory system conjugative DNA transfer family protein [Agrobacterium salinitolerans]
MTHCDFRFRDLKARNTTVFLICDYSRMDVFAPWVGLLIWAALKELIREDNAVPVHFILDEFTNYKLPGLPNALTALAGYGVHCWMIVQELSEIARVYGHEALKTILSQTDVKQLFGITSIETATMVSRMLGDHEQRTQSFGLGQDITHGTSLNLSISTKPQMTGDQLRRMPDDEQIIIIRNLLQIRALRVGVQEIEPWCSEVAPNPLQGGKRFIGKVRLRIVNGRFRVTRHGKRKIPKEKRPLLIPILASLAVLRPGSGAILLMAAITTAIIFGWPSLRVQYSITSGGNYRWCEYYGLPDVTKPQIRNGAEGCPIVVWSKSGGSR